MNTLDTSTFPRTIDRTQDGITTCLLHRQWEWTIANYVPTMPHCTICGGVVDPRLSAHSLCTERQKRGLPIMQLDSTPRCDCAKCSGAQQTNS